MLLKIIHFSPTSTNSLPSTHGGLVSGPLKLVKNGLVPNIPTSSKVFEPLNILGKRVLGTSNSKINVPGPISVKNGLVPNLANSSKVYRKPYKNNEHNLKLDNKIFTLSE